MYHGEGLSGADMAHLKSALDEAAIIAITDKKGTITYANAKFCAISKYSLDELIGQNHRIINSRTHPKSFFIDMWKTISAGKVWEGEIRNRAKDGSFYWVHTTIVPFLDEQGHPDKYVAVRYDITERKAAEEQLKVYLSELESQKESVRTLFNSTFEGIVVHDAGTIVDANETAARLFGYAQEQMKGSHLLDYLRSDQRDSASRYFLSKNEETWESVGVTSSGREIYLELASRFITLKNQKVSLLAVRDITQRRELETQILQQDRLASLGLLASSLAHEIGTPLGVIRGRAEFIAKKRSEDVSLQSDMQLVVSQIDRISKLVKSLLQLARGQKSESAVHVHVKQVTGDVTNLISHELEKKGIQLECLIPDDLYIKAEPGPLGQVLLNFLVNSVHAIELVGKKERHLIQIEARKTPEQVLISVEDTGCGISQENLQQLFKPFFTTKDIGEGTGLGLATSYKIVQSWGGTIQVQSKVGQGTKFTLVFSSPDSL